ncbi:CrcB family protein [Amaricoccus sp.]|uniref:fluoride efflux transporter FluC n=1 Tax=Amaricoccus sp. TaxID=1872485 RepID=UPI001B697C6E|nr:CrcB family protein [Amaricoccus sp.]MBP7240676.1 CrcB family protein [Amaricoccus sp.]
MLALVSVALGGALGGAARHLLALRVTARLGDGFPWGILAVNLSGSAAIGALAAVVPAESTLRLLLVTGFLGGYTTVSTFSLQALTLFEAGLRGRAGAYVAGSVAGSILMAAAGFALGGLAG